MPRWKDHFNWTTLGSTNPEEYVETDYALGIGLLEDETRQAQSLNTIITLSQNRYLFNSESGKRGYLNVRITEEENRILRQEAGVSCSFAKPCVLYRASANSQGGRESTVNLLQNRGGQLLQDTIKEGVGIFGLTEKHIASVVAIPLTPAYAKTFLYKDPNDALKIVLIGDAAISHHFWPGRGLNTGLNAAVALARNLLSRGVDDLSKFEAFMQVLREREMQGRSASMLRKENALPSKLIEEVINAQTCSERLKETRDVRAGEEKKFVDNLKAWLERMQSLDAWPHARLDVTTIEDKFLLVRTDGEQGR